MFKEIPLENSNSVYDYAFECSSAIDRIYTGIDCMVSNAISDIECITMRLLYEVDPERYKNPSQLVPSNIKPSFCLDVRYFDPLIISTVYKGEDIQLSFTIDEINEIFLKIGVLK